MPGEPLHMCHCLNNVFTHLQLALEQAQCNHGVTAKIGQEAPAASQEPVCIGQEGHLQDTAAYSLHAVLGSIRQ